MFSKLRDMSERIRDERRRKLVLRLMDATGLSEVHVYKLLERHKEPTNKLIKAAWRTTLKSA